MQVIWSLMDDSAMDTESKSIRFGMIKRGGSTVGWEMLVSKQHCASEVVFPQKTNWAKLLKKS